MKEGLEFGIDPQSKKPIRVSFEGNLTTIAAPRDGKGLNRAGFAGGSNS
jgi:hypothetical protein